MTWPMKPLSELCVLAVDCVNKTAPVVDDPTPYKMIRTTNVKRGFIDTETVRYVTEAIYEQWTRRSRPQYGDVVLTREAPVGEVGRCTFDESQQIFLGQRLFQYRPAPDLLDWNYLAYVLQSPLVQNKIHGMSFGATVPHIKVGDAENLEVPCPPIQEQRAIGNALAAYDDLIETNRRRIALLEEAARLLYREWFVNRRYPGHEIAECADRHPDEWHLQNLYDVADLTMGFPFQAALFNTEKIGKAAIRIRDIPDVTPGTWTTEDPRSTDYEVRRGDFLIGMDGMFHMNHWIGEPAWLVQRVCRVRPKDRLYWGFIAHALHQPIKHFEATISGATVAHLGAKHLKSIDLLIPPRHMEDSLSFLNDLLDQKISLMEANAVAARARNELLPKLMSGAIQV
jgi:type I restriction enzyme S subunit